MRGTRGLMIVVPLAVLATAGCATKGWVNNLVGKKQAEVNDRVAAVETKQATDAQRFDQRVGGVESSVTEASQTAKQAGERADAAKGRADEAFTKADEVGGRVTRMWNARFKRTVVETVDVRFGFNRADLSDGAQTALLGVVREMQEKPDLTVNLEGFTDPTGPRDYNVGLSQRRVEAVRRYLIDKGADLSRIYAIGRGPLNRGPKGEANAQLRRVTVTLMIGGD